MNPSNVPAVLATNAQVAWLCLLTITAQAGTQEALYVVNNSEPLTSRGQVFEPYPFAVQLPADDSDSMPTVSLAISNLDARIVQFVREQAVPPAIKVELVTSAFPDVVEKSLDFLKLTSVSYDALTLQGSLNVDDFLTQRFPAEAYVPPLYPGLFR